MKKIFITWAIVYTLSICAMQKNVIGPSKNFFNKNYFIKKNKSLLNTWKNNNVFPNLWDRNKKFRLLKNEQMSIADPETYIVNEPIITKASFTKNFINSDKNKKDKSNIVMDTIFWRV